MSLTDRAGFGFGKRSFYIWDAVTSYLNKLAVRKTMAGAEWRTAAVIQQNAASQFSNDSRRRHIII
jgi:hypothetical protein